MSGCSIARKPGTSAWKFAFRPQGASDIGLTRRTNEDAFGFDFERSLFVVCDGVGGSSAGEIASHSAVDTMLSQFPLDIPDPQLRRL